MKTKAQSALEYMMTYGWAILIIVIVAAVLYSMGIFNPSAASGNTSSGFGGFSVTSYSCSASRGLSVTLGNNQGHTITLTGGSPLVLTSTPSGMVTKYVAGNGTSVVAGGVFTVNSSSLSACGSAGGKYSVEFTYKYIENGLGYNTTGTVQGTVAS